MRSVRLTKSLLLGSCCLGGALPIGIALLGGSALFGCSAEEASNSPSGTNAAGGTQGPTSGGTTATMTGGNAMGMGMGSTPTSSNGTNGTTGAPPTTTGPGVTNTTGGSAVGSPVGGPVTSGAGGGATVGTDGAVNTTAVSGNCGITVDTYELAAIATVGVVTFSATSTLDSATIDFAPSAGGTTLTAPVDLAEPGHRTLLLGMKGDTDYSFQIKAVSGGQACASEMYTLTTGSVRNDVPIVQHPTNNDGATRDGFIVLSAGLGGFGGGIGGGGGGSAAPAYIIDMDGNPVWWADAPASCSRALMDWEGKNMWMMELNVDGQGGEMRKIAMDGTGAENNVQGLSASHHDFTVLPGGIVATVLWTSGAESPSDLVERSPDGTIKKVVTLNSSIYAQGSIGFHANSILYQPWDDSYTISDRYPNLYVKLSRTGQLLWQFGGSNPVGEFISGGSWQVNHGHHLLEDGTMLVFNNGNGGGSSPVIGFQLNEDTSKAAEEIFRYSSSSNSAVLGDVQRLPNGNTLVTYSMSGIIHEVSPSGTLVQVFQTSSMGYAQWRPTLYGAPPK